MSEQNTPREDGAPISDEELETVAGGTGVTTTIIGPLLPIILIPPTMPTYPTDDIIDSSAQ